MINTNDFIQLKNVIEKSYRCHYSEMEKAMKDFFRGLDALNITIVGPFMYTLRNVPKDEIIECDFLLPILEDDLYLNSDYLFHSYYEVYDMFSLAIFGDFNTKTEAAYAELLLNIRENNLVQVTPIYHIISKDDSLPYLIIKVGVSRRKEDQTLI